MADIELVIKIPEELYETYKGKLPMLGDTGMDMIAQSIANGKLLPKGHGALKDVDKIGLTDFECYLCNGDYKEALKMLIDKIENAPTIIEADKEADT